MKKIGVTPILIVVSALFAFFVSFSGIGKHVFPDPPPIVTRFMLANVGVACATRNEKERPQATDLLVMISSDDVDYIKHVHAFLADSAKMQDTKTKRVTFVPDDKADDYRRVLWDFGASKAKGAEALTSAMRTSDQWIAYRVPLQDPKTTTFAPIPTIFDKNHHTRLFVVVRQLSDAIEPELAWIAGAAKSLSQPKMHALPLFEVAIGPKTPVQDNFLTNLNFEIFGDHVCWHVGGVS